MEATPPHGHAQRVDGEGPKRGYSPVSRGASIRCPTSLLDALDTAAGGRASPLLVRAAVVLAGLEREARPVGFAELEERTGGHRSYLRTLLPALRAGFDIDRPSAGYAYRFRLRGRPAEVLARLDRGDAPGEAVGYVPATVVDRLLAAEGGSPVAPSHGAAAAAVRHAVTARYDGAATGAGRHVARLTAAGVLESGRWSPAYRRRLTRSAWHRVRDRRREWARRACPRCSRHAGHGTASTCPARAGPHRLAPPVGKAWSDRCARFADGTSTSTRAVIYPAEPGSGGAPAGMGQRRHGGRRRGKRPGRAPPEYLALARRYVAAHEAQGGRVTHGGGLARQVAACLAGLPHSPHPGGRCGADRLREIQVDYGLALRNPRTYRRRRPPAPPAPPPLPPAAEIIEALPPALARFAARLEDG